MLLVEQLQVDSSGTWSMGGCCSWRGGETGPLCPHPGSAPDTYRFPLLLSMMTPVVLAWKLSWSLSSCVSLLRVGMNKIDTSTKHVYTCGQSMRMLG